MMSVFVAFIVSEGIGNKLFYSLHCVANFYFWWDVCKSKVIM